MPLTTSSKTQPSYDVIVVGSGAGGGQTAYTCTMAGAKVLMLEAGRNYDPVSRRCTPSQSNSSNSATCVSERQAPISRTANPSKCSVKCEPGSAHGVGTVLTRAADNGNAALAP